MTGFHQKCDEHLWRNIRYHQNTQGNAASRPSLATQHDKQTKATLDQPKDHGARTQQVTYRLKPSCQCKNCATRGGVCPAPPNQALDEFLVLG